jgi:hypothetical protein
MKIIGNQRREKAKAVGMAAGGEGVSIGEIMAIKMKAAKTSGKWRRRNGVNEASGWRSGSVMWRKSNEKRQ